MKKVLCHITFHGQPACQCQYPASIVYGIQCEFESLADARRVAHNLKFYSKSCDPFIPLRHYAVKVVSGGCPTVKEV